MPYKNKTTPSRSPRRIATLSAILLLVLISGLLYMSNPNGMDGTNTTRSSETETFTNEPGKQKLNLDPPTESEKKHAEDNKEALARQMESAPPPASGTKKSVKPQLNNPGQFGNVVEVRAFVPGIIESDGTCTATFTLGATTFTKTTTAIADATTTRCATISVPRSEFNAAGTWTVSVAYSSAASQGTSDQETFTIQ